MPCRYYPCPQTVYIYPLTGGGADELLESCTFALRGSFSYVSDYNPGYQLQEPLEILKTTTKNEFIGIDPFYFRDVGPSICASIGVFQKIAFVSTENREDSNYCVFFAPFERINWRLNRKTIDMQQKEVTIVQKTGLFSVKGGQVQTETFQYVYRDEDIVDCFFFC